MWRKFWWRNEGEVGVTGAITSAYAPDVLFANWVAPVEFTAVNALAPACQAPQVEETPTDAGAFLSRVYANQEC
ncbi:MAG: hypothetical protein HY661_12045 [Betaproteobacteria bacterium]|nr:hypothetical protein [Betaproteobacteria bacterium]